MQLCTYCKRPHAPSSCPLYLRAQQFFCQRRWKLSSSISAQSPAPFIGHTGYPHVSAGVLSTPERVDNTWEYDAPRHWAVGNYQIPRLVDLRSSLVNSRNLISVHSRAVDRIGPLQEVGMANRPADVDITLARAPLFSVSSDAYSAPSGPRGDLRRLALSSNPHIPTAVEKAVSDTDLKATQALRYLAKKGFGEQELTKLLSVGTLGIGKRRKLVPTKWSITATDDTLGKQIIDHLRDLPVGDTTVHFGGYLGNHFCVILFSRPWSYELFEMSTSASGPLRWTTDHEGFHGRKGYVSETAGGYYAARLAIAEHLRAKKRQCAALVLRFITPDYTVPLGVWVVREAVRKALASPPRQFSSPSEALAHAKHFCQQRFGKALDQLLSTSKLRASLAQRSLSGYFS